MMQFGCYKSSRRTAFRIRSNVLQLQKFISETNFKFDLVLFQVPKATGKFVERKCSAIQHFGWTDHAFVRLPVN